MFRGTKCKMDALTDKINAQKQEVKHLKKCETSAVLANDKMKELSVEVSHTRMEDSQKYHKIVKLKKTIETLEAQIAKFNTDMFDAMRDCADKKLKQNRLAVEYYQLELMLKQNKVAGKKEILKQQSIYCN